MTSEPTSDSIPRAGRIAAIDYGSVRIGLAVTDPDQKFSSPLENYTRRSEQKDGAWLQQTVQQERLVGLVVGLPLHTSGSESQKSAEVRRFVAWLHKLVTVPIVLFDERFTTSQANELLAEAGFSSKQRKLRRDMLAAQILLQSYLESDRTGHTAAPLDDANPA
ncbi:Holliday junction resolvase RuvX [Anatilimnocola floriformis]|uniref:Holliday junction resolvase RuvX n=1 Tax=Anatilimnocola floriformis TaxID=2948575 RepID=UPI0020C1EE5F|nr:Holliday junction resolvase RuvX [Anatilimnocola floriformis]